MQFPDMPNFQLFRLATAGLCNSESFSGTCGTPGDLSVQLNTIKIINRGSYFVDR